MKGEKSCKDCKHLVQLPFGGEFCECEESDLYLCDVDIREDICKEFEEKGEK